jgi:hypothetical protein
MKSGTDVNHRHYETRLYLIEICFDATYGLYNGRKSLSASSAVAVVCRLTLAIRSIHFCLAVGLQADGMI